MAEKLINSKVQQRNDTAANWTLANPILLRGEIGIEYDTGKIKIGDIEVIDYYLERDEIGEVQIYASTKC